MENAMASKSGFVAKTRSKKARQDESIMNTNNSCIVSKRSVEKIYHGKDYGFRHFVRKFQRRSPLINRGYWLRMRAVDDAVLTFLRETSRAGHRCAVINLGCGYDVIPFRLLSEHPQLCRNTVFADVDYPELMKRKCTVVDRETSLRAVVNSGFPSSHNLVDKAGNGILLSGDQYIAVGCDLTDTRALNRLLVEQLGLADRPVLFVAEVSMTYMEAKTADKVIQWASSWPTAQFCLLEQFLPEGPDTPFAKTMLAHFEKLNSPLRTVLHYQKMIDQEQRFLDKGWATAVARDIWDLWNDDTFLTPDEAAALDHIEPFDEWEELALFGSHYFILRAMNKTAYENGTEPRSSKADSSNFESNVRVQVRQSSTHRRHGATYDISSDVVAHHGGQGARGRLPDTDLFCSNRSSDFAADPDRVSPQGPPTGDLMCHTISSLGSAQSLLVGGRTSPEQISHTCLWRHGDQWTRVEDLPRSRFRHCAAPITTKISDDSSSAVVVFGGMTNGSELLSEWLIWASTRGWQQITQAGDIPSARYGAAMCSQGRSGYLTGGMRRGGRILHDLWHWSLTYDQGWTIICEDVTDRIRFTAGCQGLFGRFGAHLASAGSDLYLIGGIGANYIPWRATILRISKDLHVSPYCMDPLIPRAILTGHSVQVVQRGDSPSVVVLGGGATCFSFGTFWNETCYTLLCGDIKGEAWQNVEQQNRVGSTTSKASIARRENPGLGKGLPSTGVAIIPADRQQLKCREDFAQLLAAGKPVILERLELGSCTSTWTLEYLKDKIGEDREVTVHKATSQQMNFLEKNFAYQKMPFGQFVDDITCEHRMYLRTVSTSRPADAPANLELGFPSIAQDFRLPDTLDFVSKNTHSSPLRISGPVTMWLHYDVMANVFCQIRGRRRLVLFPPQSVVHLKFPPGASSSPLEVFDEDGNVKTDFDSLGPIVCDLRPGDVLFIPPVWPHTAIPIDSVSVAVNVFFRSLEHGYAAGRDVYGNRDIQAYENGRRDVQKIMKAFRGLPPDMARFYLERLSQELNDAARDAT